METSKKELPSFGTTLSLGVNTSGPRGQICLFHKGEVLKSIVWEKQGSHSEKVTPLFQELLKEFGFQVKNIEEYLVVTGPGSFTGLRVAVNFCRSLAYAFNRPIYTYNSLDLLALNCGKRDGKLITCMDAQKNSLFLSEYTWQDGFWKQNNVDQVVPIQDLDRFFNEPKYLCGQGHKRYAAYLPESVKSNMMTETSWEEMNLCWLLEKKQEAQFFLRGSFTWHEVQAQYIKASAAEEKLQGS